MTVINKNNKNNNTTNNNKNKSPKDWSLIGKPAVLEVL